MGDINKQASKQCEMVISVLKKNKARQKGGERGAVILDYELRDSLTNSEI